MTSQAQAEPADSQAQTPGAAVIAKAGKAKLICVNPQVFHEGCEQVIVPLTSTEVRVGRGAGNDFVIDASGISRVHALFSPGEQGWQVRDLGSANGIMVNKTAVTEKWLADGDVISMGTVHYKFSREGGGLVADAERQVNLFDVEKTLVLGREEVQAEIQSGKPSKAPRTPRKAKPGSHQRSLLVGLAVVVAAAVAGYLAVG